MRTVRHKISMRKTPTARQCETLSCPAPRRRIDYRDTVVPGLCLRVTATARKTLTLRTRVNRRQVRYAIGSYPLISLADAREQARKILRDNQLGRYERPEERQGLTLGEVVPEFIAKHVMVKNRDQNATQGCLKRFAPLYDMPLVDIKRAHVIRILDSPAPRASRLRTHADCTRQRRRKSPPIAFGRRERRALWDGVASPGVSEVLAAFLRRRSQRTASTSVG